jgi:hypothetical protein
LVLRKYSPRLAKLGPPPRRPRTRRQCWGCGNLPLHPAQSLGAIYEMSCRANSCVVSECGFLHWPRLRIMLEAQYTREVKLWQTCHEIAEKSSKIVLLGAPFNFLRPIQLTYLIGGEVLSCPNPVPDLARQLFDIFRLFYQRKR